MSDNRSPTDPREYPEIMSALSPREREFAEMNLQLEKTYGIAGLRAARELGWSLEMAGSPDFDKADLLQKVELSLNSKHTR